MSESEKYQSGRDYWNASIIMTPAAQGLRANTAVTAPYEGAVIDISFVLVCCNHESTVKDTLATVCEAMDVVGGSFEILVIDDVSKDRTIEIVREFIGENPLLHIMLQINLKPKNTVLNYVDGSFTGRGKYYRLVYCDNSEAVETMVDCLRSLGEADIIAPYYVSMRQKSFRQRYGSGIYNGLVNLISGHRVNFYAGLHIHLRYNVMRWRPVTMGNFFQTDLLCQLLDFGFTCKQVPCRAFPQREKEGFKQAVKHGLSGAHTLLELAIRRASQLIHD